MTSTTGTRSRQRIDTGVAAAGASTATAGEVLRGRLSAAAMTAGAVCLVAGHALNTPSTLSARRFVDEVTAHHTRFAVATLLTSAAALLLVASAWGVARLVRPTRPRAAVIGGTLAATGSAALAVGVSVIGFTMTALTGADPAVARQVFGIASDNGFVNVPFYLAPLLTLGLLILAVALLRDRAVPRWPAVLLAAGAVLAVAAPAGGIAGAVGHLPLAVALVALARELWRTTARVTAF